MIESKRGLAVAVLAALGLSVPAAGQGLTEGRREAVPSLTVAGRGQARVAPDEATVRLGVLAQEANAGEAQQQVNRRVAAILEAVRKLGVRPEQIQTSELSLSPVFAPGRPPQPGAAGEAAQGPRIVGYQASNVVSITLEKLDQIGAVIDAGLGGGANRLEGVGFGLRHDDAARQAALRDAVAQARSKAGCWRCRKRGPRPVRRRATRRCACRPWLAARSARRSRRARWRSRPA
jgi:uncharacterized protein YggE